MISHRTIAAFTILALSFVPIHSWTTITNVQTTSPTSTSHTLKSPFSTLGLAQQQPNIFSTTSTYTSPSLALCAVKGPEVDTNKSLTDDVDVDKTTKEYGLEAGLFQSLRKEDGGESAKSLLAKYGIAYLATSIPLAIVSFTICYALVDLGVDVVALLDNLGIPVGDTSEKVGTFAIAYTAHKAASPIRFPPTVMLTPVVAKLIGKEPVNEEGA
mmetsp:Transcript_333/g.436  ORF Transcript_333/g.436 Transcript_333/m.436 type:complete len:214 (-) Transcript_333:346-987(-)|eukprot:CAMPEP_0197233672 /NCGR_PEP_ID=MMETSP1429-20130617/1672_1 /TAXON_ID=49237 /ORGANISM="Chaetoceros  sp., Strain UNC1202" /LENGTH=213 /DNA_ID=CAMNT_0042691969 /DNA_START=91 /DNA_END=732 /DNA_ORIENTATION=+